MVHSSRVDSVLQLPNGVVGVMDIRRLSREAKMLNDFLHQSSLREPGTSMSLPKLSRIFNELAESNGLNLLQDEDRQQLTAFLGELEQNAPRLHISFSVDPSPYFLSKLLDYIRKNIDAHALVQVGLQPNIGAGCVVRSTNQVFDMSLREDFRQKRSLLMDYVKKLRQPDGDDQAGLEPAVQDVQSVQEMTPTTAGSIQGVGR